MKCVFFDLEWNQGYPRSEAERLDEIIQIGAWKLEDGAAEGEGFSAYVRPTVHRRLHHRVRKMLPLEQTEMLRASRFPEVIHRFFRWCGEDAVFFTWGPSDARVVDLNLIWYGMEEYLSLECRDLQRIYDIMLRDNEQQTALKDAVEALGLVSALEYHNAGNDAQYTALIAAELLRRWGDFPTEEQLRRREQELLVAKREQAALEAEAQLERVYREETPLVRRDCGLFPGEEDCLKSRSARVFRCPRCESRLCNGNWYRIGAHCVARSRCTEHGRFYTLLHQQQEGERWRGECRVYTDETLPAALFSLCKLSGEQLVLKKLPKKRKRTRHHGRSITVRPSEK